MIQNSIISGSGETVGVVSGQIATGGMTLYVAYKSENGMPLIARVSTPMTITVQKNSMVVCYTGVANTVILSGDTTIPFSSNGLHAFLVSGDFSVKQTGGGGV